MKISLFFIFLVLFFVFSCGEIKVENHKGHLIVQEDDKENYVSNSDDIVVENEPVISLGIDSFWVNQDIASAKLFMYQLKDLEDENYQFEIVQNNRINPGVIDSLTAKLDKKNILKLQELLANKTSFQNLSADCFNPHHGIVFYDKHNEIKGHISICLECSRYIISPRSSGHIPIREFKKIIIEAGLPVATIELSKKNINPELLKKLYSIN